MTLSVLIVPILVAVVASVFHVYPFAASPRFQFPLFGRATLFAFPAVVMVLAFGAANIFEAASPHRRVIMMAVLLVLVGPPVAEALRNLIRPPGMQETRPVFDYIDEHKQAGDVLYINWGTEYPFLYYREKYDFKGLPVKRGRNNSRGDWSGYEKEIESLKGNRRIWFVLSYIHDWKLVDDERLMLHFLDKAGKRVDEVHHFNAAGYLYDLSE